MPSTSYYLYRSLEDHFGNRKISLDICVLLGRWFQKLSMGCAVVVSKNLALLVIGNPGD